MDDLGLLLAFALQPFLIIVGLLGIIVFVVKNISKTNTRLPDAKKNSIQGYENGIEKNNIGSSDIKTKSIKSPIIATLLSIFLLGGGGQIYLGQWKKGLALILTALITSSFSIDSSLLFSILISIIGAFDAYGTAQKMGNGELIGEWEFNLKWW
jgi:TM2 domain-containing membrane protein YozV